LAAVLEPWRNSLVSGPWKAGLLASVLVRVALWNDCQVPR
jgi:hypothetical protein